MPIYQCDKCDYKTTKKTDFERHRSRKISCDDKTIDQIIEEKVNEKVEQVVKKTISKKKVLKKKQTDDKDTDSDVEETKEAKSDINSTVMNLVNNLHNTMRGKDAITGPKAFHDIIRLLMIRFMEPMLEPGKKLESMMDAKHYESINEFDSDNVKLLKFTELMNHLDDDEFEYNIYLVWDMLSVNKLTENIFRPKQTFNCKPKTLMICCLKIQEALKESHFDDMDNDIKGQIYENFINGYAAKNGAGKEFGQFFTPRKMINIIFNLNKEIFENQSKPENIYDPCAGTGGFLTEMYKLYKIDPENIYGGELEPDTFATGLMNLLLTTGSLCNITNGDSLVNNDIKQFDWIATNPPFGMKGIKHKQVVENLLYKKKVTPRGKKTVSPNCFTGIEMYPINTNDGSALFLQHCIARLKYGGVCNIVLPNGQLMNGKIFTKLRKYLVDECVLKAVLDVPGGTFEHTDVQTAVLFFTKFEEHRTDEITFYQVTKDCDAVVKLGIVDYDQLESKSYNLNWNSYKPKEERKVLDSTWEIKKLGEICEFISQGRRNSSEGKTEGKYPLYYCSILGNLYINDFDEEGTEIIINKTNGSGKCAIYLADGKYSVAKSVIRIKTQDPYLTRYIYNNMKTRISEIEEMYTGMNQKQLSIDDIKELEIPIPSLEKQKEIITRCEEFKQQIEQSETTIEQLEKTKKLLADTYIRPLFTSNEIKKLGEVCTLRQGEYVKKDDKVSGEYDIYGGGDKSGNINRYNAENCIVVAKDGISINCVRFITGKFFLNHHAWEVKSNNTVDINYLRYYLQSTQQKIFELATGSAQKGINQESFKDLEIPVPDLETQQEIVKKYEKIQSDISKLDNIISDIKVLINDIQRNTKKLFC